MTKRKKKYPKVTFGVDPGNSRPVVKRISTKEGPSEEWLDITAEVENWVDSRNSPQHLSISDQLALAMSFELDHAAINITRIPDVPYTMISTVTNMVGDDAEFYQEVGEHDWRVFIRSVAFQINRGEIHFHNGVPAFQLVDYLYDDAFTVDALYQRCRSIQSGLDFIRIFIKSLKRRIWLERPEGKSGKKRDRTAFSDLETQKDYTPGPHYI